MADMDNIHSWPVFPDSEHVEKLAAFDEALPQQPQLATETLRLLDEYGSPATVAQTGGRYFGFVNGNAVSVALAARWLSDIWNQNPALHVISPTVAKLEQVCEQWVRELLNLPSETHDKLKTLKIMLVNIYLLRGKNEKLVDLWNRKNSFNDCTGSGPARI